ncbi:MAG: DHH family phosphoesterase [Lactovum sp.]
MNKKNKLTLSLVSIIVILTFIETSVLIFFGKVMIFNLKNPLHSFMVLFVINLILYLIFIFIQRRFFISQNEVIQFVNEQADDSLKTTLENLPVAIIRFNSKDYQAEWYNKYSEFIFNSNEKEIDANLIKEILEKKEESSLYQFSERYYRITIDDKKSILYLQDVTTEKESKINLGDRRPIIGVISIDNYDEQTDTLTEGEKSIINSFIATFLEDFALSKKMYLRRQTAERFIFFSYYQVLSSMMENNFVSLIDEFRKQATEKNLNLSLSVGISYGVIDFSAIGKTSLNNLELALIRGGNQVVVKENNTQAHALYFGGNSESRLIKSRTRVRAISSMLKNIITESEQVFIVGHKFPDMDALGSSIVMKNFALSVDKKEVYIVYDESQLQDDIKRAIDKINEDEEVASHILRLEEAKKIKRENSLLIMVDHSKLQQTLDREFYNYFSKVLVIDHHRRDEDFPENSLLSYIESAASSATEMTVEILQFQEATEVSMTPTEASIALAGISVDTQSFTRTNTFKAFEAASYLRQQGASNEMVQYFLATDFETFKAVNEIVLKAEITDKKVAIAQAQEDKKYRNVTLAQAADKLLSMKNVETSFTMAYAQTGEVLISARSNGKVNVQLVMEKLGGGGHFEAAATQISDKNLNEVKEELLKVIRESEEK